MKKKSEKVKKPEKAGNRRKEKVKGAIAMLDLPKHLRSLADMIEKGKVPLSADVPITSISSLKLIFKYKDYRNIVRTSIFCEYPAEYGNPNVQSNTVFIDKKGAKKKVALKKLKKRIGKAFAEISAACDAGALPDVGLVAAFYEDYEALTLEESGINPYLEESLQAVRLLSEAVGSGDAQRTRDAVERYRYIQSESESMNPEEKK